MTKGAWLGGTRWILSNADIGLALLNQLGRLMPGKPFVRKETELIMKIKLISFFVLGVAALLGYDLVVNGGQVTKNILEILAVLGVVASCMALSNFDEKGGQNKSRKHKRKHEDLHNAEMQRRQHQQYVDSL